MKLQISTNAFLTLANSMVLNVWIEFMVMNVCAHQTGQESIASKVAFIRTAYTY